MTNRQFSEDQILNRIRFENPWWDSKSIDQYYSDMPRRAYFDLFKNLVNEKDVRRAVVLMGPRRVGKTVLIYHTIQSLIDSGINPKKICYLSIDTPIYTNIALERLLHLANQAVGNNDLNGLYIFFDEIQYLRDWEIHLKSLVDSYLNVKFIVSGSAAAALKLKSIESGAGRFTEFILPPLTFYEYLKLSGNADVYDESRVVEGDYFPHDQAEANRNFINYINYGGYPEAIVSKETRLNPERYIRNDIIDKVLLRDLPSLYGIQDIQELNALFTTIAYNTGNEVSLEELSKNSGVAKNTIRKYLTYLEAAFLIKIIKRIDLAGRRFQRENFFKIYLTNSSIRSALFSPINSENPFFGNLVETAIFAQWQHSEYNEKKYYARWKGGEVDLISLKENKPNWVVEIKWSNRFHKHPNELKSLLTFCKRNSLGRANVTTIDIDDFKKIDNVGIKFVPASNYCYSVGKNIIQGRLGQPLER